jgi:hypothetical protein
MAHDEPIPLQGVKTTGGQVLTHGLLINHRPN